MITLTKKICALVLVCTLALSCFAVISVSAATQDVLVVEQDFESYTTGDAIAQVGGYTTHKALTGGSNWVEDRSGIIGTNFDYLIKEEAGNKYLAMQPKTTTVDGSGTASYPMYDLHVAKPLGGVIKLSFDARASIGGRMGFKFQYSKADGSDMLPGLANNTANANYVAQANGTTLSNWHQISATDDRYNQVQTTMTNGAKLHYDFTIDMSTHLYDLTVTDVATSSVVKQLSAVGLPIGANNSSATFFAAHPCFNGIQFVGFTANTTDLSTYQAGLVDNFKIYKVVSEANLATTITGSGTVKVDGAEVTSGSSTTFNMNGSALEVTPAKGYEIKSVKINGAEQNVTDATMYTASLSASGDSTLEVVFAVASGSQILVSEGFENFTVGTSNDAIGSEASKKSITGAKIWVESRAGYIGNGKGEIMEESGNKFLGMASTGTAGAYPEFNLRLNQPQSGKINVNFDIRGDEGGKMGVKFVYSAADGSNALAGLANDGANNNHLFDIKEDTDPGKLMLYYASKDGYYNGASDNKAKGTIYNCDVTVDMTARTYKITVAEKSTGSVCRTISLPLPLGRATSGTEYNDFFTARGYFCGLRFVSYTQGSDKKPGLIDNIKITKLLEDLTTNIGANGSVKINGEDVANGAKVYTGSSATATITPASGYAIDTVTLDGADVKAMVVGGELSLSGIKYGSVLNVTFKENVVAPNLNDGDVTELVLDSFSYVDAGGNTITVDSKPNIMGYVALNQYTGGKNYVCGFNVSNGTDTIKLEYGQASPGLQFAIRVFGDAITSTGKYTFTPYMDEVTE